MGFVSENLLAGKIPGGITKYVTIEKGFQLTGSVDLDKVVVIFFIKGAGNVKDDVESFDINGMTAFLPRFRSSYTVAASTDGLEYLEISYDLMNNEMEEAEHNVKNSRIIEYSKCGTYREAIKSMKTINRTILDENALPRFCMGSVETSGPDEVMEHSHSMLDQLFFGLPGNDCIVRVDGEETFFGEGILLHIPLGSTHSVRVEEGRQLHYLWMDFFKNQDMSYITNNHIAI